MTMPSLTEVRDAAVALLRTVHPDISRVEAFSGEITLDAVAGKGLPPGVSVLVAAVAADNDAQGDSLDFDVMGTFGALVVSNNVAGPVHSNVILTDNAHYDEPMFRFLLQDMWEMTVDDFICHLKTINIDETIEE